MPDRPTELAPAVDVRDLHVVRGNTHILRGVSCTVPAGGCTAILGPNGCGKTTFTRVLTGHAFFGNGQVNVLGETIGHTDVRALRRRISVVNPTAESAAKVRVMIEFNVPDANDAGGVPAKDAPGPRSFTTVGVNENIVDASWEAITDAFAYYLMEAGEGGLR